MKCQHCQTEIADNALICYRCGRATSEPRIRPPAAESLFEARRSRWPFVVVVVLLILVALALVWFLLSGQANVTNQRFIWPPELDSIMALAAYAEVT